MIDTAIGGNAVEPRGKPGIALAPPAGVAPDGQENLLGDVVGIGGIARETGGDAPHAVEVARDEQAVGPLATIRYGAQKLVIGILARRGHSVSSNAAYQVRVTEGL